MVGAIEREGAIEVDGAGDTEGIVVLEEVGGAVTGEKEGMVVLDEVDGAMEGAGEGGSNSKVGAGDMTGLPAASALCFQYGPAAEGITALQGYRVIEHMQDLHVSCSPCGSR